MPYICLANAFMGSCTTMQLPNLIDANEVIKAVDAIIAVEAIKAIKAIKANEANEANEAK